MRPSSQCPKLYTPIPRSFFDDFILPAATIYAQPDYSQSLPHRGLGLVTARVPPVLPPNYLLRPPPFPVPSSQSIS